MSLCFLNHIETNLLFLPIFFCLSHFFMSVFARVLSQQTQYKGTYSEAQNIDLFALYVFMGVYSKYKNIFAK